jgi:hypothetical protein
VRSVVGALLLLALAPAAAHAAPALSLRVAAPEVRFGKPHRVSGVLADGTTALGGQTVVVEGQRTPFTGGFRELGRAVTDASGAFKLAVRLDRNYKLRATVPALTIVSPLVRAYTFPAVRLTFRALRPGAVRLIQLYTVPRTVRLTEPTLFYLGRRRAARSTVRARGTTRRVRPGHFRARATVKLPAAWHGRFRFASCFHTSPRAGMGRPKTHCPKRFRF